MAYSPEKKAEVCAELIGGLSCAKAAAKHGVGKATVVAWYQELKELDLIADNDKKKPTNQNRPKQEKTDQPTKAEPTNAEATPLVSFAEVAEGRVLSREEQFQEALFRFLLRTMSMDEAIAIACSDPKFIQSNPGGVIGLAESIRKRADTLVSVFITGRPLEESGDEPGLGEVAQDPLLARSQQTIR